MSSTTAILIFGRQAAVEAQHKLQGKQLNKGAERLCQALLQQTRHLAKASELPVIWVSSAQQQGDSFGERLCHAFDQVWSQGYTRVLLLGTDTPNLSTSLLQQAAQQLDQGQAVLGAAQDGGIYLMGIERGHYCSQALAALPWEHATLFQALHQYLEQTAQTLVVLTPVLGDIDNWNDARQWIYRMVASRLRLFLIQCLQYHILDSIQVSPEPHSTTICLLPCNRPPPHLAA